MSDADRQERDRLLRGKPFLTAMVRDGKNIVRREVHVDADLGTATSVFAPQDLDLDFNQTVAEMIAEQRERGETAYSCAKDLDLLSEVAIHFQVVEHYSDGTQKCVERVTWDTEGDDA